MFKCKACLSRDKTIAVLEEQNKFLRELVQPRLEKPHSELPMVEADAVLTNSGEILDFTDEQEKEFDAELSERDRLLSGNY